MRNKREAGQSGWELIVVVLIIAFIALWAGETIINLPHHIRKHVKIEKLKSGKYVFDDNVNGVDTWWYFDGGSSSSSVTRNANGTLTFPRGGTWIKGEKPDPEEEEEIDEANVSENEDGSVDSDATADSSSGVDGAGDSGGDGGGDGGDGGGGSD